MADIKLTQHKLAMLQNAAFHSWMFSKSKGAQRELKELEKFLAGIGMALKEKGTAIVELLEEGK